GGHRSGARGARRSPFLAGVPAAGAAPAAGSAGGHLQRLAAAGNRAHPGDERPGRLRRPPAKDADRVAPGGRAPAIRRALPETPQIWRDGTGPAANRTAEETTGVDRLTVAGCVEGACFGSERAN